MRRQGKYTRRVTPTQHVKRHVKQRFHWWRKLSWKKKLLAIGAPILVFIIVLPLATYMYFARDIADQDRLMNRNNTGIVLYANDGKTEVYANGRAEHHDLIPIDKISTPVKNALVASEDKDFYKHSGFSVFSTLRAVYGYIVSGGGSFGGSTITQQLAKITVLSQNRSFLRQYQAFSIAVAIENTYTKDQILDMYLNSVYFGENAFGIEDAAKIYFGTTPDKLDLAQASMLIGLLPAPSVYSPISGNAEYAKERQTTVLSRMVTNGYINKEQKQGALAIQLAYQPPQSPINDSIAPHFSEMVLKEIYDKYGEETVTRSGYQVTTTLDASVQNNIQSAITANMPTINRNGGHNAASVAIDPTTGEIRGLVGSYNWQDENFGKVNVVTSLRQPGSSFKPIYYAKALADGVITPATILKDVKTDFGGYVPLDADKKFRGDVTVRNALDWSLNIPAVQVMQKLGIDTAINQAQRMGLSSIDSKNNYGLSLALGSAEVTPLALTNAYASFANQGKQFSTTTIKDIKTKYGDTVYKSHSTSKQVISPQGAFLTSNILSDNSSRSAIFGNSLNVYDAKTRAVKTVAVKTGTTNDSRDAWTVGYTPQLALGVWVGNNDNQPMTNGGSIMAGPIFTKAMGNILAGVDTKFPEAPGVVQKNVCYSNRGLADKAVKGSTYSEWFLATALPTASCTVTTPSPSPTPTTTPTTVPSDKVTAILSVSPDDSAQEGETVTFTVNLSPSTVTGTVIFRDGDVTLGTIQVVDGSASLTTSLLAPGQHAITAIFTPTDQSDTVTKSIEYQITVKKNNGNGRSIFGN
ncbi:MAG: transglycosylase domain-containing protein [Candidatus Saccharimonadales bacterium]